MTDLKGLVRTIPDYPKAGILFRDVTTLLGDAQGFKAAIAQMAEPWRIKPVDAVAGIEARGFILGGAIADRLGCGFIPIRKKGKLPWKTIGQDYQLEYGVDVIEMHEDACRPGERILIVDDLIATGGTAEAGCQTDPPFAGRGTGRVFHNRSAGPRRNGETFWPGCCDARIDGIRGALMGKKKKIKITTQELMQAAMAELRMWQADGSVTLNCPVCGEPGLVIKDRSARPLAEWYALKCKACGLDDKIHIPLPTHRQYV